jgi:outer membrane protein
VVMPYACAKDTLISWWWFSMLPLDSICLGEGSVMGVEGKVGSILASLGRLATGLLLGSALAGSLAMATEPPAEPGESGPSDQQQADDVDRRVLERARKLLDQRQPAQAYELLTPHEDDWSGDPEYDYLLGTAAVHSGRADDAVMPLERAVAQNPGNSDARLALARAYYHSGDPDLARIELEQLGLRSLPGEPGAGARSRTAAGRGEAGPRETAFRYFVLLDVGYDSNVNGATDDDAFLGLALNNRNVETDSAYAAVSNGGILQVPLSSRWDYNLRFNFMQRRNLSATFANTDRAGLSNEFTWRGDYTRLRFGAGLHTTYLDSRAPYDGDRAQSGAVLDFGARWLLGNSAWQIGTDVVAAALRHNSRTRVLDVDQYLSAFVLDYLGRDAGPSFGLALIYGEAQAKQSGSPYGRDQYGVRLTSGWPVGSPGRMYAHIGVMESDYDGRFFGESRDDTEYSTGLSAVLQVFPSRAWSLIPHLTYIHNQSSVSLYDYDRTEIGLAIRWLSD